MEHCCSPVLLLTEKVMGSIPDKDADCWDGETTDASTSVGVKQQGHDLRDEAEIPFGSDFSSADAIAVSRQVSDESLADDFPCGRMISDASTVGSLTWDDQQLLEDRFEMAQATVGAGAYSTVRRGTRRSDGKAVAVKTMPRKEIVDILRVKRELELQQSIDHPNIITLVDVIEDSGAIHAIQELGSGGDLYDYMVERCGDSGLLREPQAAAIMRQVAAAVEHLHGKRVAHRDIKLENVVLERAGVPAELNTLKLTDFGFARHLDDTGMTTLCGTAEYSAPEVLRGNHYNEKCDVWSLGIMAFVILSGNFPFSGSDDAQVARAVTRGRARFNGRAWTAVSPQVKAFVKTLLEPDPAARPSAAVASASKWLVSSH